MDDIHTLRESFGYSPHHPEQWTLYAPPGRDPVLVVIHPERKPRIYKLHCGGVYTEFDPEFC